MCILEEDDLFHIIKDKEVFARFILSEREQRVLKLHIVKGLTFGIISGIEKISIPMVHKIYARAIKKMKKQMLEMLMEKGERPVQTITVCDEHYIGGNGEPGNHVFGRMG